MEPSRLSELYQRLAMKATLKKLLLRQGSILSLFKDIIILAIARSTQADVVMFSGCKDYQTSADTNVSGFGATGAASFAFVNTVRRAHYHHNDIS